MTTASRDAQMSPKSDEPFTISRTFNAPRGLVWAVFTQPEHMVNWWAAPGTKPGVCHMDLRSGGSLHYSMIGPDGSALWGLWLIQEVTAPERLTAITSFSDENRGILHHPMAPGWPLQTFAENLFTEEGNQTTFTMTWAPYQATDEQAALFAASHESMIGGWTGTLNLLSAYISTLTK